VFLSYAVEWDLVKSSWPVLTTTTVADNIISCDTMIDSSLGRQL